MEPVYKIRKEKFDAGPAIEDIFISRAIEENVINREIFFDPKFVMSQYALATEDHFLLRSSRNAESLLMNEVRGGMRIVENIILKSITKVKPYTFSECIAHATLSKAAGEPWQSNGYSVKRHLIVGTENFNCPTQYPFLERYFENPTETLWKVAHKLEAIKLSKYENLRDRYVVSVATEFYLAQMKLFPAIDAIMDTFTVDFGFLFKFCDRHGNFIKMYELLGKGRLTESDFSDCDLSEKNEQIKWFFLLIGKLCNEELYAEKLYNVMVNRPTIMPSGRCYMITGGNPSGNAYTYCMNTLINLSMLFGSISYQNPQKSIYDIEKLYYEKVIKFFVGGDDCIYVQNQFIKNDPKLHEWFCAANGFDCETEQHDRDSVSILGRHFGFFKLNNKSMIVPIYRTKKILVQLLHTTTTFKYNIFNTFTRVAGELPLMVTTEYFDPLFNLCIWLKKQPEWSSEYMKCNASQVEHQMFTKEQIWSLFSPLEANVPEEVKIKL